MFPMLQQRPGEMANQTSGPIDVARVPAPPAPFAPVPFPNVGPSSPGAGTASKVKINNKPSSTRQSRASRSSGDEAGTMKGMVSGRNSSASVPAHAGSASGIRAGAAAAGAMGNAAAASIQEALGHWAR